MPHTVGHHYGRHHGRRSDVDMTQGSVFRHLLFFSLPLLAGNLFQQMYNMVDTWVVGNFVSNEAFSAVGSATPIVNMLIGSFMGLASGAEVVISQYYGAKREEDVRRTVHTAVVMTLVLSVVFSILGVTMTPLLLRLMKTPEEVFSEAVTYLSIYFAGMTGLLVYNMGAGILRAVGDSRRPFYYLVCTAVINTVLDLVFVIGFGMGVEGVAYATILAQGISALLTVITLLRTSSCVRVEVRRIRADGKILRQIVQVGFPAALQMAVTAFSNVFVRSYINQFGTDCMSGWTAYIKADQFIFLPMQSLGLAATTFVGQNLGRGQEERAKKGVRTALLMSMAVTLLLSVVCMACAPYIVAFFNDREAVVEYGTMFLRRMTPFYVIHCFNQVLSGAQRGAGNSKIPMIFMLGSFVVFRQCYLYVVSNFISNTILPLALSFPAGWLVCSILSVTYYKKVGLSRGRLKIRAEE